MSSSSIRLLLQKYQKTLLDALDTAPELTDVFPSADDRDSHYHNYKKLSESLTKKFERFKEYLDKLAALNLNEFEVDEQQSIKTDLENSADTVARFDDKIVDLDEIIHKIGSERAKENQEKSSTRSRPVREEAVTEEQHSVKLPKLELARFNGKKTKWQEFWDSFQTAVHDNKSLSPGVKLAYLQRQLDGDASKAVNQLKTIGGNYEAAIEILKRDFGNPRSIVEEHYNALSNVAVATSQTESLRSVYASLEQTFFGLESAGVSTEQDHFISLIKSKLPWTVKVHLEDKKPDDATWTVKEYREQLGRYIRKREFAEPSASSKSKFEKMRITVENSKTKFAPDKMITTTGALFSNEQASNRRIPKCRFCDENHWSDQCLTYPTIEARKAKIKGHCFICFKQDHMVDKCWSTKPCHYCRQVKAHHSSLCPSKFPMNLKRKSETNNTIQNKKSKFNHGSDKRIVVNSESSTTTASVVENSLVATGEAVYLQTATTQACSPNSDKSIKIRLLMDSGSHRSYVSNALVERLKLKSKPGDKLSVFTFGNKTAKQVSTSSVDLKIQLVDGTFLTLTANSVPTITGSFEQAPFPMEKFGSVLKTLVLADDEINSESPIDLLIGSDYYSDIMTSDKIQLSDGLYLLGSRLGWILNGRQKTESKTKLPWTTLLIANIVMPDENLSLSCIDSQLENKFDLQKFWDLDTIGIKDRTDDREDEEALHSFNKSVKYENGQYFVKWPWKENEVKLPSNYNLSMGRLNSLIRRYKNDPAILRQYHSILEDQLSKGIIEKIDTSVESHNREHYLPHHPVITPNKLTTKMRIVYDGSSKSKKDDKSINECLLRGPVMLEDVCHLLLRFRLNPVALVADIEKAFLQVGLQTEDRDVTRFLWLRDPNLLTTENNVQVYRFARVPFGFISSPFLLSATIAFHLKKVASEVAENILKNMYVDNLITGVIRKVMQSIFIKKQNHFLPRLR